MWVGVKKRHGRTDTAQEQMWHERADVARRDNEAGVSKGKTIKKKTYISHGQTGAVTKASTQPEEARRGVDKAWSGWC